MNQIGTIITVSRQNKNMTQEELASRLGVTSQAISKWERGVSVPDVGLVKGLCEILEISSDYLLGVTGKKITESGDRKEQEELCNILRDCLEPLEILIGEDLVPFFQGSAYAQQVKEIRKRLASQGILVPLVHIKDSSQLEPNEFMILSYNRILYEERMELLDQVELQEIMDKFETTVHCKYSYIINPDIVKVLVDNLRINSPALVDGVVPEHISYHLLTEILRQFMNRGYTPVYLKKVIEIAERELRRDPGKAVEEIVEVVQSEIAEDNIWGVLANRK